MNQKYPESKPRIDLQFVLFSLMNVTHTFDFIADILNGTDRAIHLKILQNVIQRHDYTFTEFGISLQKAVIKLRIGNENLLHGFQ